MQVDSVYLDIVRSRHVETFKVQYSRTKGILFV